MSRLYYLDRGSVIDLWTALVSDNAARIPVPADLVIRDEALLESALALSRQPYYPTTIDKAAVLMRSLVKNHPFVDGNKRMGFVTSLVFLWFNGYVFAASNDEVVEFVLRLAASDPARCPGRKCRYGFVNMRCQLPRRVRLRRRGGWRLRGWNESRRSFESCNCYHDRANRRRC